MARSKVDTRGLARKMQKAKLEIAKAGKATVSDLAYLGKSHAKTIVPFHSGKTASLIKVFKGKDKDGPYADVVAQNPTANDGHKRNISNFNLVRWMHATNGVLKTSQGSKKHITSGDPRFMYRTTEWLRRNKIAVAKGHFNTIKIR